MNKRALFKDFPAFERSRLSYSRTMYRDNSSFERIKYEEFYSRYKKLIKDNIIGIQRQSFYLRNSLAQRRKDIAGQFRTVYRQHEPTELKTFKSFNDKVQKELILMEEDCEKFFAEMQLDLLIETRLRSEPLLCVPSVKVEKALQVCRDALLENGEDIFDERCHCLWKNVSKSILEGTMVRSEEFDVAPSNFDKTDLKFKQDLTALRTKLFSLTDEKINPVCHTTGVEDVGSSSTKSYHEIVNKYKRSSILLSKDELNKIHSLKFIDGEFATNEQWTRVLDIHANQLRSKWYFVVCPQIEKVLKKRRIYSFHLKPSEVFTFLLSIPDGGIHFILSRKDLFPLLENVSIEGPWLTSWKPQLTTIDKEDIAAVLIQSYWRGYWLRKQINESHRRYIAASVLWYKWLSVKNKREMNAAHLRNMLMSLNVVRDLSTKFSEELNNIILQPHVIIHVPSVGFPLDIRRTFSPKRLGVYQQSTSLRISFLRNPMSEIIYVLPVKPTQDFLSMYVDIIDSVASQEDTTNRMTFLALSQAKTFEHTSMNLSRILHCSEDTLTAIRGKIKDKPTYILPWIVDECDVRISDNLRVPLLGADMKLQQELLNLSRTTEIIDGLSLPQPAHSNDIREYSKLCSDLAELIVTNTEICLWLIRLNFGIRNKHDGVFLINHISVPFMPVLREVRKRHGDEWKTDPDLRKEFLNVLSSHLPKVVSSVTRLNGTYYDSWKDFYIHIQKFGCLLQAVPNEKHSSTVTVSLFVPNERTKMPIKWIGTSNKLQLDSDFSTIAYMIPQTSVNVACLHPNVNKLARALRCKGYFGYLTIDCYCYPDSGDEENTVVLLLDIHPYYCHVQHYIDWLKFVIDGSYNITRDTFTTNFTVSENNKKEISTSKTRSLEYNENIERTAIVICELYHVNLAVYSWSKLKTLMTNVGIFYDTMKKEGCHFILHDTEMKNVGTMVVVTPGMKTSLSTTYHSLRKLCRVLSTKKRSETNMTSIADFFEKLSLDYRDFSRDPCDTVGSIQRFCSIPSIENKKTTFFYLHVMDKLELRMSDSRVNLAVTVPMETVHLISYNQPKVPTSVKFIIGGMSGIAAQLGTHPMDVVRLQMQITNGSFLGTIKDIFARRGLRSFYDGLSAGLLRQITYTMTKLGIYTSMFDYWTDRFGRPSYAEMIGMGMFSGLVSALVGTPADVILVRMVGDAKLPPEKRRNYKNSLIAILDISRNEGIKGLWSGALPTIGRATIVTGAQLGTYSRAKYALIDTGYVADNLLTQFLAANVSSCASSIASLPLDVAKTKIQNWPGPSRPPRMISIIIQTARESGFLSLWRGFLAFYTKAGPATIIAMLCVDQLRDLYIHFFI